MYSRGPMASAAPHLYESLLLARLFVPDRPAPAPPMSSFTVLATSIWGMEGIDD